MKRLFPILAALAYAFMYAPILVIIVFSFSDRSVLSFPITGWTLDWYKLALTDDALLAGLFTSLEVATAATLLALALGTLGAFAVQRYGFPGRDAFRSAVVLPILLPGVITGVAMLSYFATIGVGLGLVTVIIGHVVFGFPVVFNNVAARLSRLPRSLEESAADLGAPPAVAFRRVTLPLMRSALVTGGLLAFTLSFDEVIVTIFLTGADNTLPMVIWSRLRFQIDPEINAIVTIVFLISGSLVLLSQRFLRDR